MQNNVDKNPILLIEDEASDAVLIRRGLAKGGAAKTIDVVRDGQSALDYLFRAGTHAEKVSDPLPCLVLIDLKLPKVGGLEVINRVKATPHLQLIPIVALTSSSQSSDRRRAYENGVNSYLVKPSELQKYTELGTQICQYWLGCNVSADHIPSSMADDQQL